MQQYCWCASLKMLRTQQWLHNFKDQKSLIFKISIRLSVFFFSYRKLKSRGGATEWLTRHPSTEMAQSGPQMTVQWAAASSPVLRGTRVRCPGLPARGQVRPVWGCLFHRGYRTRLACLVQTCPQPLCYFFIKPQLYKSDVLFPFLMAIKRNFLHFQISPFIIIINLCLESKL